MMFFFHLKTYNLGKLFEQVNSQYNYLLPLNFFCCGKLSMSLTFLMTMNRMSQPSGMMSLNRRQIHFRNGPEKFLSLFDPTKKRKLQYRLYAR
jgi:hypothetical protein